MKNSSLIRLNLDPEKLIQDYFDEEAQKQPDKVALYFEEQKITYQVLAAESIKLAAHLQDIGVCLGEYIGIYMPISPHVIISMMAILRVGAIYVPLDAELPPKRLTEMISQCQIHHCLTVSHQNTTKVTAPFFSFISVDELAETSRTLKIHQKNIDQIAYVNFSSGSTGKPKAIACTHRGALRLFKSQDYLDFSDQLVFLQAAPVYFDAATFEIWGALLSGGTCVMNGVKTLSNTRLTDLVQKYGINTAWLTSSLFDVLVETDPQCFQGITQLLVGGDVVSPRSVAKIYSCHPEISLVNGYGPTENTTFTCCYRIPRTSLSIQAAIPIGKPLKGTEVFVLDENNTLSSLGELYIAGDGLAAGYVQQGVVVDMDRFFYHKKLGRRVYKTGDLVHVHSNGILEFKGRADNQIKLNGYRIELEEIEHIAKHDPMVKQAICLAYITPENTKFLLLFVVVEESFSSENLLPALKEKLPCYMIPHQIIYKENFPLKATGKIDKEKLLLEYVTLVGKNEKPRLNSIEDVVNSAWQQTLLITTPLTKNADFFDLGGSSLSALRCLNFIHSFVEQAEQLPVDLLYQCPTFGELTTYLRHHCQLKANFSKKLNHLNPLKEVPQEIEKTFDAPLNPYQRSMVYQEIFSQNKSFNTLLYILKADIPLQDNFVLSLIDNLFKAWPLLSSKVIEKDLCFYFNIDTKINTQQLLMIDEKDYLNEEDFKSAYEDFYLSLFVVGKLRLIKTQVKGKRKWVLALHHIVYDDTFVHTLIQKIEDAMTSCQLFTCQSSDLAFIQENQRINASIDENKTQMEAYWRAAFPLLVPNQHLEQTHINDEQIFIDISLPLFCQAKRRLPLSIILSVLGKMFSEQKAVSHLIVLMTVKNRFTQLDHPSSGYATNLVPFYLALNKDMIEDAVTPLFNQKVLSAIQNGLFPKEEIFSLTKLTDEKIDCLINLIYVASTDEAKLFASMFKNKTRYPLTISIFMSKDQLLLDVKSTRADLDLASVCQYFNYELSRIIADE